MMKILAISATAMLGLGAVQPAAAATGSAAMATNAVAASTATFEMQRNDRRNNRRDHRWRGDQRNWDPASAYREGNYRERRLGRNDRIYRGNDGRVYCRRNDGTTGLVVGAVGGGVLGNLVGGGTLGTLLGAGGGALLGREIDRGEVRCR